MRYHTIEERLDYALVNDDWGNLWPVSNVFYLARYRSDHNPIVLDCGHERSDLSSHRVRLFRFEVIWLQDREECSELIYEIWGDTGQYVISNWRM